jgi:uncharacterized membrane protein (DUF4010 family)
MEFLPLIERLAAALAIGFLIGIERGWKQREAGGETRVAGLRTYAVIGLLGGVSGVLGVLLGPLAFAALTLAFILPWFAFKSLEVVTDQDVSVTGLMAGLAVFALAALAGIGQIQAAAAAAVALAAVLAFKHTEHAWLRGLTWEELRSALVLLAATLIALPLLPDRALDPLGALNPRALWLLTILLAGASFAGYVALKALGPERGLFVGGLAAALVSSTAMTIDLARRTKSGAAPPGLAAAVAAAGNAVMITRALILLALLAPATLSLAAPVLGAAILVSVLIAAPMALRAAGHAPDESADPGNPLDLKFVARLALSLGAIIVLARIASSVWGDTGLLLFAGIAGLVDVDAITLAVAQQIRDGLTAEAGVLAVLVAVAANTLAKTVFAAAIGRARFSLPYAAASLAALGAGASVLVLWPPS